MLEPFVIDSGNLDKRWKIYMNEVNLFLLASGITNDTQKRAVLLHVSGKQVRQVFNTFTDVGTSYQDACDKLQEHFVPKKNIIYERWQFRNARQTEAENCLPFVTRLKNMAETCEYGNQDEEVRDQFVFTCFDNKLREKFLQTKTTENASLDVLLDKYSNIFEGDGLLKGYTHKLHIDEKVIPVAQRLRRYPLNLRKQINEELHKLQEKDFIEPVNKPSKWISNFVIVPKKDGSVRACLDARAPNKVIKRQTYPIPTLESIIDDLAGARYFSKIDLRSAYCQILLDEPSRELTTFITEKGMYRYKRMVFGLTSASEDFQRLMEHCFSNLPGVKNISDDMIIYSQTIEEHFERLEKLFERAFQLGLRFNLKKCAFLQDEISFFGIVVRKNGVSKDPSKVEALKNAPSPKNTTELKSFLGLATFCSRFVPDFSTAIAPLRDLLKKKRRVQMVFRPRKGFCRTEAYNQ